MRIFRPELTLFALIILALLARTAGAANVQDLVRLKGHERNVLVGLGLVVGLPGTGDTAKDAFVAARPFARYLTNLGNPVTELEELRRADAFAIVSVTMEIPPEGVREGDRLDIFVEKLFNARSLRGGRLVVSLLRVPGPDSPDLQPMAFAEGALVIEGDDDASAVIRRGGQMLADIRTNPVASDGTVTLVLKEQYAGYPVAAMIAELVNEPIDPSAHYGSTPPPRLAWVEDAKNVRVRIPDSERANPASFLAWLMQVPVDPAMIRTPSRIVINERAGIISVTGDVEIGPVGITHRGMQLTTAGPGGAGGGSIWAGLDTTGGSGRTSTRLLDLLRALEQLKVPVDDQIRIIHELRRTGALHAEIISR